MGFQIVCISFQISKSISSVDLENDLFCSYMTSMSSVNENVVSVIFYGSNQFGNFTKAFSILLVLEESHFVNLILDGTYPCC